MTRYLLDNGILIAYLKGRPGASGLSVMHLPRSALMS